MGLDVSGAIIRNDLAALEKAGFAVQPHTSAGRVPTAAAYRYYVDHLRPRRLPRSQREQVSGLFTGVRFELSRLLRATSDLLSELTHYPSVVVGPGVAGEHVRALHLVQMGPTSVMVVLVTDTGRVQQALGRADRPVAPREIAAVEEMMESSLVGHELRDVECEPPPGLSAGERAVFVAVCDALARTAESTAEVYVGGTTAMARVWEDLGVVQRVLEVIEREATLLGILAQVPGTSIQIVDDLPLGIDMSVVSTSYGPDDEAGRVGVLGPMRMICREVISAV